MSVFDSSIVLDSCTHLEVSAVCVYVVFDSLTHLEVSAVCVYVVFDSLTHLEVSAVCVYDGTVSVSLTDTLMILTRSKLSVRNLSDGAVQWELNLPNR